MPADAGSLSHISDAQLSHGFLMTVFGTEGRTRSPRSRLRKFEQPVRFSVEDRTGKGMDRKVADFIARLPRIVPGLDARLAMPGEKANFDVIITTRANYRARPSLASLSGELPGQCATVMHYGRSSIRQTTSYIVADEGAYLFNRCMVEEILQGLGPINDDNSLKLSMFNDTSHYQRLTAFDRAIVNMLYDPRITCGMTMADVTPLLPQVIRDVRRKLR
ncbi:DUF2927 domain-containing protein [Hartmannibacter diazotrophicus]|uniref:DUF2927 domain-containing protein n=1 Tax=Hartmannibacter diazotrophicus TaxID=1482074 RepID=UPI0012FDF0C6|nr:DUF2927 domain-containing protein [Hartmannibacter diazotrophicus]